MTLRARGKSFATPRLLGTLYPFLRGQCAVQFVAHFVTSTILSRRAVGGEKTLKTIETLYRRHDRPPPIRVASCEVLARPNPATASTADPNAQEEAFLRTIVRHYDGLDAHVNGSPEQPHAATADGTTVWNTGLDSDGSDVRRPVYRNAIARSVGVVGVRYVFWDFRFPVFVRFIIIPPPFLSLRLRTGPRHDGRILPGRNGHNGPRAQTFSMGVFDRLGFDKRKNVF